jgi:hypothetical protein
MPDGSQSCEDNAFGDSGKQEDQDARGLLEQ